MQKPLPLLTTSALGLITICILVIVTWNMFPVAMSQTLDKATQDQDSAAELSAAIEAQRQVAAKLTRSASFDQRFQKLSEKAQKNGIVSVIVKVRAGFKPEGYITSAADRLAQRKVIEEAQDRLLAGLSYEPSSLKRFDDIPYMAVTMDSYGLTQLQSSADVLDVVPNISMKLATGESVPQIKAGRAWRAGYTGAGKTIVVLDSGVDKTHPALLNKVETAEACFSTHDPVSGYESLCPGNADSSTAENSGKDCDKAELSGVGGCGHGSHIAGIATGVAKDAKILSIQVMSYVTGGECGLGTCLRSQTSDVMEALDHVYNNLRNSHSIAAVNISLVTDITGTYHDPCDADVGAPLKAKIDQLRSVGVPTVIAAGNDGFTNALGYPACISTSVSVGAVGDGSGEMPADTVWQDSNSADYLSLLAPGDGITSAIPGGGTTSASGTSQAAAHVSGAWAILKQMEPAMSVDDALNRLYTTGAPITDTRNGETFRRIQIDEALGVTVPEDMWEALYYNNPNLEGIPAVTQNEGDGFIDRFFNTGANPVQGIGAENYSVRWIRTPTFTQTGTYRFSVTGDDGVRLYIDDRSMIPDGWVDQPPTTYNVDVDLDAGDHEIRLEYYQGGGPAQVRLNWGIVSDLCIPSQDPPTTRWKGEYYNNAYLRGDAVAVKDNGVSDSLNFNWGGDPPNTDCNLTIFPDYFSVRWTRSVDFTQGKYLFTVSGDNGVRLKVGNDVMIERWTETVGTNTAEVSLAGGHTITLEYFETWGGASVSLSWALLAPDAPTNLGAFPAASTTAINLSWEHNRTNVSGFKIERWNGGGYSEIATVGANTTAYTDSPLAQETTYTYRVRAYNSAGNSAYSNDSSATTRLPTPSPLSATPISSSQIKLEWPNNSATESGYRIERLNGGSWGEIAVVGADATIHIDSSLPPGTTFTYRVRAYNSLGSSEYSNPSSATTQLPPCSYGVSPTSATFESGGGSRSIAVSTAAHCSWSAASNDTWFIQITSGASGAGNGSVNYSVNFYNEWDGHRQGTLTVAGRLVTIEQFGPPCPFIPPEFCPSPSAQPNGLDLSSAQAGPRGLTARYFGNATLSGRPALERTDSVVNFNWASNSPNKALAAGGFSARWSGQLAAPSSEAYTFYLYSEGGARLWVNNHLVIDRWRPPFERQTRSAPIELKAGEKADVRMEYYHTNGDAEIRLLWSSPSTSKQIIPRQHLYPEAATNEISPADAKQQTGMLLPPGSDSSPKAPHPQPIAEMASPLSRVGLALLITCGVLAILLRINRGQARKRFATAATCVVLRLRKWMNTAISSGDEPRLRMFAVLKSVSRQGR
jgi:subtilisin